MVCLGNEPRSWSFCHFWDCTQVLHFGLSCWLQGCSISFKGGFPGGSAGRESACNAGDLGLIPGLWRSPGEGNGNPTPVFFPGEFHGQRGLVGYSPWGCTVRHDWVTNIHIYIYAYSRRDNGYVNQIHPFLSILVHWFLRCRCPLLPSPAWPCPTSLDSWT